MNWLNSNMHSDDSDTDTDSSESDTHIISMDNDHSDAIHKCIDTDHTKRLYACAVCDQSTRQPIYNKDQSCLQCPRCKRSWCLYDPKNINKCANLDLIPKRYIELKFSQRKAKHDHHTTNHRLSWIGTNVLGNLGNIDATLSQLNLATNDEATTFESLRAQRRFGMEDTSHPTHPVIIGSLPQLNVKDNATHELLLKRTVCPICQDQFMDEESSDDGDESEEKHEDNVMNDSVTDDAVATEEKAEAPVEFEDSIVRLWCGHLFHSQCVVPWLSKCNTCPVCRFTLPSNNPSYELKRRAETYGHGVYHVMT